MFTYVFVPPSNIPVTTPVVASTVATDVFELDHVPPLTLLLNVTAPAAPEHVFVAPVMFGMAALFVIVFVVKHPAPTL